MASISFANESLMDPRIQVKLDKYQKCGNIMDIYIYIFVSSSYIQLPIKELLFIYLSYLSYLFIYSPCFFFSVILL